MPYSFSSELKVALNCAGASKGQLIPRILRRAVSCGIRVRVRTSCRLSIGRYYRSPVVSSVEKSSHSLSSPSVG